MFQAHCPFRLCSEASYHPCVVSGCAFACATWGVTDLEAARIGGCNAIVPQTCSTWGSFGHKKAYEGRGFMRVLRFISGSLPSLCFNIISQCYQCGAVLDEDFPPITALVITHDWNWTGGTIMFPNQFSGCTSVAA